MRQEATIKLRSSIWSVNLNAGKVGSAINNYNIANCNEIIKDDGIVSGETP